jgi:hypothetical protein
MASFVDSRGRLRGRHLQDPRRSCHRGRGRCWSGWSGRVRPPDQLPDRRFPLYGEVLVVRLVRWSGETLGGRRPSANEWGIMTWPDPARDPAHRRGRDRVPLNQAGPLRRTKTDGSPEDTALERISLGGPRIKYLGAVVRGRGRCPVAITNSRCVKRVRVWRRVNTERVGSSGANSPLLLGGDQPSRARRERNTLRRDSELV